MLESCQHAAVVVVLTLLLSASPGSGSEIQSVVGSGDESLRTLYEREYAWRQAQHGKIQEKAGKWVAGEHLPRVDANTQSQRLAYWDAVIGELDAIPVESLSDAEQINAAVFRQIVQSLAENTRFKTYEAPLNSDTYFWTISYPRLGGYKDVDAYRRYLSRLQDLPRYFSEQIDNMRAGLQRGYSVPAITLAGREASIAAYLSEGRNNPYWTPLGQMPASIAVKDRQALEQSAEQVINAVVLPAYRELLHFMQVEYLPATRKTIAASELPDGAAFYQSQIRNHTTLNLSPEDIHQQGLNEVARIRQLMERIKQSTGFKGDMAAFIKFLRSDPRFYAKTAEELLAYSAYVAKRMDGNLDKILGFLPRQRFTILPVPDAIAPHYTAGRGGLESCLMNTYDLPSRPLYTLAALTLHECSPGHALQAAIALEAPGDIPQFRKDNYFSGYGEGWGLYTEWLGAQLGIYRTPYEDFGRLSYEMWRAARLVIDTGLHHYDWSREQAQQYLSSNTALSVHEVTTEVDRYISWPGQALAYKLGEMLIRRKRAEAEEELGKGFDQRYFHDTLLGLRSVPLPVLESELDRWVATGGLNPYE